MNDRERLTAPPAWCVCDPCAPGFRYNMSPEHRQEGAPGRIQKIPAGVCKVFEAERVEFSGEHDHIPLFVHYPPKVAVSKRVASQKAVSGRMRRQQFGDVHPWLKRRGGLWSLACFASSCGGAPANVLKRYIEEQQTPF